MNCDTLACIRATWLNFVLAHTFNGLIISHFSSLVSFVRRSFVSVKKSKIGGALSHSQAQTFCVLNRSKVVVKSMELNNVCRMIGFYFLFDFMCANNRLNMLNYTENFIFSGKWFAQCANTFSHAVIQGYCIWTTLWACAITHIISNINSILWNCWFYHGQSWLSFKDFLSLMFTQNYLSEVGTTSAIYYAERWNEMKVVVFGVCCHTPH